MSNALAIAGVTSVLQHYLYNLYGTVQNNFPSPVHVSCLAPDQVQQQLQSGQTSGENRVNLFLHLVTYNAAWRNVGYASLSPDGQTAIGNPPLALDLHYLLTVYGSDPWQSEALLGFALMMLHESPVLTRDDIETALAARKTSNYPYNNYPLNLTLGACGLNDQVEMLKITPESMGREEMAWLWTALKADYRLTFPFQVSVTLMQPDRAVSYALPVLTRSIGSTSTSPAVVASATGNSGQAGSQPGDRITLLGTGLSGANQIWLEQTKVGFGFPIPIDPSTTTDTGFQFTLPLLPPMPGAPASPPYVYPAGNYNLQVQWTDPVKGVTRSSSPVQLAIAPWLPETQNGVSTVNGSDLQVTIQTFVPPIWPGQSVSLALNNIVSSPFTNYSAEIQPVLDKSPVSQASFLFPSTLPTATSYLARLAVDGVSSQVLLNTPANAPPTFAGPNVSL